MSNQFSLQVSKPVHNWDNYYERMNELNQEYWKDIIRNELKDFYQLSQKSLPTFEFSCMWMYKWSDLVPHWEVSLSSSYDIKYHRHDLWIPKISTFAGTFIPDDPTISSRAIMLYLRGRQVRYDVILTELERIIALANSESISGLVSSGKASFQFNHKERWEL
jgi:hypothetical protein